MVDVLRKTLWIMERIKKDFEIERIDILSKLMSTKYSRSVPLT